MERERREGDGELLSFGHLNCCAAFSREIVSHSRKMVGGSSTGAGPKILFSSRSVCASDPGSSLLGNMLLVIHWKGGLSALRNYCS